MLFQWGNTLSLGVCVFYVLEHISLGICVSRDMCFRAGGTHITRDVFPG